MTKEIRPVAQRIGRGDNPDKIMVANREVGRSPRPTQDTESARAIRDGVGGLAQPESGSGVPDAQLAWKQRRATTLMRHALSANGVARTTLLEGLPDMLSDLADQQDPTRDSNLVTRLLLKRGQKKNKAGNRRGMIPFPQDWDEVRAQMVDELQGKGRDVEAEEMRSVDDAELYRRYTDPHAKDVVAATLLTMDEQQAERLRGALDKLGLKP